MCLSACQNLPGPYAPPPQRQPLPKFRPYRYSRIVDMADGDAPSFFVRDITGIWGGTWRWAGQRPAVKVHVRSNQNLKYKIDFGIAEITLKETGPVTVTFTVNDHEIGNIRVTKPGDQHFEKEVPPGWLEPDKDAIVGAAVDQVYVAGDGTKLGMTLFRIGLIQG